ncbi:hypothetical protein BN1058_00549 [Paraliobacillus sp. PM-2]|uniref:SGNH/GDSL hydrolase family protein n=1 Tax=Paraliobacillus sp. PM-2 TaxID=1462524 RepID=UPI00061BED90|nr:SGNH/GDSL hydrolase family protein [Paraliobacillus sp. PM-2]CQR46296.1 hypothetical protein BN1058_00549 [Paraliobacillus sp. PM-2]
MSKKSIFIFFTCIIFIGLIVYGNLQYSEKLKTISKQAHEKMDQRLIKSEEANRNLYTKLANGKKIDFLIIGDELGSGIGVEDEHTLKQQVSNLIEAKYNNKVNEHQITKKGADVFNGLFVYEKEKKDTEQDLIMVVFGQHDTDRLTVKQFEKNYESLLKQIITDHPKAEIFTVIQNSLSDQQEYVTVIEELSDHYGMPSIDGRKIFSKSDKETDQLLTDEGYPNAVGYELYAEAIVNTIAEDVTKDITIDYSNVEVLHDINKYDDFRFIDTPEELDGFALVDGYYSSSQASSSIRYEFSGDLLALHINNTGGLMEVYLDGEYLQQYDLNDLTEGEIHLMITDELEKGDHTAQIFVREAGKTIQIKSLITK